MIGGNWLESRGILAMQAGLAGREVAGLKKMQQCLFFGLGGRGAGEGRVSSGWNPVG
jgi:hypothetical protein